MCFHIFSRVQTYIRFKNYNILTVKQALRQSKETEQKNESNSNKPNRLDGCSIGSVIEHNQTGTFWQIRLGFD